MTLRFRLLAGLSLLGCSTSLETPDVGTTPGVAPPDVIDPGCVPTPEVCGDGVDNDCNGLIDDLDKDRDGHLAESCAGTTSSELPADDCDDADGMIFPGAPERPDGVDNDCDGFIDEATVAFDDDGDCFCEVGPCEGGANLSCPHLIGGDCDDQDSRVNPDASDVPDIDYIDQNCDDLDGDASDSIFLDRQSGNDNDDGRAPDRAVRTVARAMEAALQHGRSWVLVGGGQVPVGSDDLVERVHLAGRYDPTNDWARDEAVRTTFLSQRTVRLTGWDTPTEWQQIDLTVQDAFRGGVALWADDVRELRLVECELTAPDGDDGQPGDSGPFSANPGNNGSAGEVGCNACECPSPPPGSGGPGSTTSQGGQGGSPGLGLGNGSAGLDAPGSGGGPGGNGGLGGTGTSGHHGFIGQAGSDGSPGLGGASLGWFDPAYGYRTSDGEAGSDGEIGFGGGGGGGGGGASSSGSFCVTWYGGSGGGGGSGGRPGLHGEGGEGGEPSVAVVLTSDSDVTLERCHLITGSGGNGGRGGNGQLGGPGGSGGSGGASGVGGDGGNGGQGGAGGDGGDGGGGGGGATIGVVCRDGSRVDLDQTSTALGIPGQGGLPNGATGLSVSQDGC